MTIKQAPIVSPCAWFEVRRVPGKGYQVTSANGAGAEERKADALAVLELLTQPNPFGPQEYQRWIGPIPGSEENVAVTVRLLPEGDALYHQAWFPPARAVAGVSCFLPRFRVLFLLLSIAFIVGLLASPTLVAFILQRPATDSAVTTAPLSSQQVTLSEEELAFRQALKQLETELSSTREERAKLHKYLSQEGFAADVSSDVLNEKRSVKIIADLDKNPPPQESMLLSNIAVGRLLKLLEALKAFEGQSGRSFLSKETAH